MKNSLDVKSKKRAKKRRKIHQKLRKRKKNFGSNHFKPRLGSISNPFSVLIAICLARKSLIKKIFDKIKNDRERARERERERKRERERQRETETNTET